jgi:hypothetical protein
MNSSSKASPKASALAFAFAALTLPTTGCASIKGSFQSSSDSSQGSVESLTSPFKSSSTSSGSKGASQHALNYRRDVHSFAVACIARDEAPGELLRGISRVAELHGVSDWEESADTFAAIQGVVTGGELDGAGLDRLRAGLAPLGAAKVARAFGDAAARE